MIDVFWDRDREIEMKEKMSIFPTKALLECFGSNVAAVLFRLHNNTETLAWNRTKEGVEPSCL